MTRLQLVAALMAATVTLGLCARPLSADLDGIEADFAAAPAPAPSDSSYYSGEPYGPINETDAGFVNLLTIKFLTEAFNTGTFDPDSPDFAAPGALGLLSGDTGGVSGGSQAVDPTGGSAAAVDPASASAAAGALAQAVEEATPVVQPTPEPEPVPEPAVEPTPPVEPVPVPAVEPKPVPPVDPEPVPPVEPEPVSPVEPEPVPPVEPEPVPEPVVETPPAPAPLGGGNCPDPQGVLDAHNSVRAQYNAPPLMWSDAVAASAQAWANTCAFQHSYGPLGENLMMGFGLSSCRQAAEGWANEARHWPPGSNDFVYAAGHFTAMVWKSTTQLGCGWANCPGRGVFMVCHYNQAGNVQGWFNRMVG